MRRLSCGVRCCKLATGKYLPNMLTGMMGKWSVCRSQKQHLDENSTAVDIP